MSPSGSRSAATVDKPKKIEKTKPPRRDRALRADQAMIPTQCGHCGKIFTNPTEAYWHVNEMHAGT